MARPRLFAGRAAAVAACGCALGLIALVFDASPLFVPAVGLLVLGALTPAWVWSSARGANAARRLEAERVVEGELLEATLEITRRWPRGGGWGGLAVTDPLSARRFDLEEELSPVGGGRTAGLRVVARFPRRGRHRIAPPTLTVSDPLELAQAQTVSPEPAQELLVLPATESVRWLRSGHGRRLKLPEGRVGSEAMAAVDLDGLRPYRPGTSASRIHWPAVARGAGLLERRLQADGDARPLVVLDARTPSAVRPVERLDAAVRAAASLVLELARGGGCGLLLPGDQRVTTVDPELLVWPTAYARLAVVEGDTAAHPAPAPALASAAARAGAMIYVAADPVERLAATLAGAAAAATVLVVPEEGLVAGRPAGIRGALLPAFSVSGCRGFVLGAGREIDPSRTEVGAV